MISFIYLLIFFALLFLIRLTNSPIHIYYGKTRIPYHYSFIISHLNEYEIIPSSQQCNTTTPIANSITLYSRKQVSITVFTTLDRLYEKPSKERNTLLSLAHYVKSFNIKAIIFTNDSYAINFCKRYGIITSNIEETNEFGIPILRGLIQQAMETTKSNIYIYINADIVINPKVLHSINALYSHKSTNWVVLSRVYNSANIPIIKLNSNFSFKLFESQLNITLFRGMHSIDIFAVPKSFSFWNMPNYVVGRWGIDRGFIKHSRDMKYDIISISSYKSYHQGNESAIRANKSFENWMYNYQYISQSKKETYILKTNWLIC